MAEVEGRGVDEEDREVGMGCSFAVGDMGADMEDEGCGVGGEQERALLKLCSPNSNVYSSSCGITFVGRRRRGLVDGRSLIYPLDMPYAIAGR